MWNLVQAVFTYTVCNDNDLSVTGMRTSPFEGILQVICAYYPLDAGIHATMSLAGSREWWEPVRPWTKTIVG